MSLYPYIAVYARNFYDAYFEGDTPQLKQAKGDICVAAHESDGPNSKLTLPNFIRLCVIDAPVTELDKKRTAWMRDVAISNINRNQVTGEVSFVASSSAPGLTNGGGRGRLLLSHVDAAVTELGGSIPSSSPDVVNISVTPPGLIASNVFWGDVLMGMSVMDLGPHNPSQSHRFSVDYTNVNQSVSGVERHLVSRGATIEAHANKVVTFSIPFSGIESIILGHIKTVGKSTIKPMRYRVDPAIVDSAIAQGGRIEMSIADISFIDSAQ